MTRASVHQQLHGYRKGHQILSTSLALDGGDQDTVDRLSDLAGRLRPGQVFEPYLTTYPLPSGTHYVVARTFQDLQAPRSGCVLTRSVLVPMPAWLGLRTLVGVLEVLVPVEPGEQVGTLEVTVSRGSVAPAEVRDGRIDELVQALFLEEERPVVVFDAPEAELIANRLLMALWPTLRRRFSVCTLALGPRRLGERDFDLVFAPAGARSRFAGDEYRRIGARGSGGGGQVHRWAGPTAVEIFRSEEPGLAAKDALGLLEGDDRGDRAAVRMVLLWHELASRAATKPTAVLGMLDILNSRGGPRAAVWRGLLDIVMGAADLAADGLSPSESWEFLLALDGKVGWETAPARLAEKVEDAARAVACRSPEETLGAVQTQGIGADRSAALGRGFADGIAASAAFGGLTGRLDGLEPDLLLRLVDQSDCLKEAMVTEIGRSPEVWTGTVERVLRGEDAPARRRVRRSIVGSVDERVDGRSLARLLAGAEGSELAGFAVEAGRAGRLGPTALAEALAKAAKTTGSRTAVRDAVVQRVPGEAAEWFLLQLLAVAKGDVNWLLDVVGGGRAGRLLTVLLGAAEDAAVRSVMSDSRLAGGVLSALREAMPSSAREIGRILVLDVVEADAALGVAFEVAETLADDEGRTLGAWIVGKALSAAAPDDARVGRAVAEYGTTLTVEELVGAATAARVPRCRVGANLVVLDGAPVRIRDGVVGAVDLLSQRLVQRWPENLGADAYGAWARLLSSAAEARAEVRVGAAGTALGFALRKVSYPVSELVVASFPTVYVDIAQLKALGEPGGDLRSLSSYFWLSWKKPKEGRGELIDAMVGAFLRSSWPPANLVLAAMGAGIESRVVKRVRRRLLGRRYIERVHRDAGRLEEELRRRVRACLAERS